MILQRVRMPTPSECFAPGFSTVTSRDALFVEQPAQLEVDRARGQVARVESPDAVLDHGDLRGASAIGSASPRAS